MKYLSLLLCVFALSACQTNVKVKTSLYNGDTYYDPVSGDFVLQLIKNKSKHWTTSPCLSHGCGNSETLEYQELMLRWNLKNVAEGSGALPVTDQWLIDDKAIEQSDFSVYMGNYQKYSLLNVTFNGALAQAVASGKTGTDLCASGLPCRILSSNRHYVLAQDKIWHLDNMSVAQDLSNSEAYLSFINFVRSSFYYAHPDPAAVGFWPMRYALSNDYRYIVAYPYINTCFNQKDYSGYNNLYVFDTQEQSYKTLTYRQANLNQMQPSDHSQHLYIDQSGGIGFVSQYGQKTKLDEPAYGHCNRAGNYELVTFSQHKAASDPQIVTLMSGGPTRGVDYSIDGQVLISLEEDDLLGEMNLYLYDFKQNNLQSYILSVPKALREGVDNYQR